MATKEICLKLQTKVDHSSVYMNTLKMAFTIGIVLMVTVVALVAGEVNINVLFKPEDCPRTAQSGDYVTVSYVAFLADESGNERFDNT